jgi:hypothetical protein
LSSNEQAVPLLEQYPENINWYLLSSNENAVHLFEQHPERIQWKELCQNQNAMHLFPLDYAAMSVQIEPLREELLAYLYDPERLIRMSQMVGLDMRSYVNGLNV